MQKRLYLVTGFLGSGKTTLMKRLLNYSKDQKVGVIVNEFGNESMDGVVLNSGNITMNEINNGSIFCSCRSDMFIDALIALSNKDLDTVFIETSGMSNPWSMPEVLSITKSKAINKYTYMGCISIIDAKYFNKLINTINVIAKQVAFADYILINKSDLVDDNQKQEIATTIEAINQYASYEFTSYCDAKDINKLLAIKPISDDKKEEFSKPSQSGVRKEVYTFEDSTDYDKFLEFLNIVSKDTYRIKGFITLDNKNYIVDCVNDDINLVNTNEIDRQFVVFISDSKKPLSVILKREFDKIFN